MRTGSQKRKEVDGLERLEKGALQHTHRLLLWLLLITLLAAPLLLPATSAQVTQTVILTDTNAEDVQVNQFNAFPTGGLCYGLVTATKPHRSFLKFDIASLPSSVEKVELRLVSGFATTTATTRTVTLRSVTSAWSESTTWSTQPATESTIIASAAVQAAGEVERLDITSVYREWKAGTRQNLGLAFIDSTETGTLAPDAKCFTSSDSNIGTGDPATLRPQLIITIPSVTLQPGSASGIDTTIRTDIRYNNRNCCAPHGSSADMDVGEHPNAPYRYRGLLKFDLSSVPQGIVVQRATVEMNVVDQQGSGSPAGPGGTYPIYTSGSGTTPIGIYEALKPWTEFGAYEDTYNGPGNLWQQLLAGGLQDHAAQPLSAITPQLSQRNRWSIPPELVQRWLTDPSSNKGLILIDSREENVVYHLLTSDHSNPLKRPSLIIEYAAAPPPPADSDGD